MNLFQKIDNYLLHNFPNIWVTKVHIFLPIAIIFMLIIYTFNVLLIGYNIKDPMPEGEWGVTLMVIPVMVFIVYWFVIQARYNVEKSGGKLSIPLEYMNFFLYFLMFFVSYLLVSFIPYTNDLKIARTAQKTEITQDIKNLNVGHTIMINAGNVVSNNDNQIEKKGDRYKIRYNNFIDTYYWEDYDEELLTETIEEVREDFSDGYDSERGYYEEKLMNYEDYINNPIPKNTNNLYILATYNQLEEIVADYIYSYNKYTHNEIVTTAAEIVNYEVIAEFKDENFNYFKRTENDYYYNWRDRVEYKVEYLAKLKLRYSGAFEANYGDSEISKIIVAWLLMLSLFVWIFKQIHWRDFLFGVLALALTPVLIGIVGLIFGVFLRADEDFFFALIMVAYVIAILLTIKGYVSNYKSRFSIVTAMYLHVWLPVLPFFYYFFMYEIYYRNNYEVRSEFKFENLFYAALIIGIISIGLFKLVYKKMRLLPNHK